MQGIESKVKSQSEQRKDLKNFSEGIQYQRQLRLRFKSCVLDLPLHRTDLAAGGASCQHSAEGR